MQKFRFSLWPCGDGTRVPSDSFWRPLCCYFQDCGHTVIGLNCGHIAREYHFCCYIQCFQSFYVTTLYSFWGLLMLIHAVLRPLYVAIWALVLHALLWPLYVAKMDATIGTQLLETTRCYMQRFGTSTWPHGDWRQTSSHRFRASLLTLDAVR
jgi:hypothetical protein